MSAHHVKMEPLLAEPDAGSLRGHAEAVLPAHMMDSYMCCRCYRYLGPELTQHQCPPELLAKKLIPVQIPDRNGSISSTYRNVGCSVQAKLLQWRRVRQATKGPGTRSGSGFGAKFRTRARLPKAKALAARPSTASASAPTAAR